MKKLSFLLIAIFLIFNSSYSQSPKINFEKLLLRSNHSFQMMNKKLTRDLKFDIVGKICTENWEADSLDNLVKTPDGSIVIESLADGKYLLTQELYVYLDSILSLVTSTAYINNPEFKNDISFDSVLTYITQHDIKYLFSKQVNYFENGNLINTTTYFDYTLLGIPTGLVKSDYINYYYDNNDFLIAKSTYTISFWDGTTNVSDSTFFINNSKGNPKESLYFEDNYENELQLIEKHIFEYDSDERLIKEETYLNLDDWTISKREQTIIQSKIEINLREETYDKGATWTPISRDSTYFNVDLPFGYPNRTTSELYKDGEWKMQNLTISKDCSATYTKNIENSDFAAGFINEQIFIESEHNIKNATINLYNENGQLMFKKKYKIVPERILINNLNTGIYILKIKGENQKGIKKLIKY